MSTYRVLHTRVKCPSCGVVHGWDDLPEHLPVDFDNTGEVVWGWVFPPLVFVCPACEHVAMDGDLADEVVVYQALEIREHQVEPAPKIS